MKPHFITSDTKSTKSLDWAKPLSRYISALYGFADEFTTPINTITKLRNDVVNTITSHVIDEATKNLYYIYFGQLELLDLRLPINDSGVYVKFSWFDAYNTSQYHSQRSLAFEKASILFNLAAILSRLAIEAFDEHDDYKLAIKYIQYAAGVYQFIQDNFLNAPSIDLNQKTIAFLNKLMLAQGQELFLLSLINADNDKYSLLAKIASAAANFYEKTNELYIDDLEFGDEFKWLSIIRFKFQFYQSLSYYYQAKAIEANKIGESIGYLNLAADGLQHCKKFENHTGIELKSYITAIEDQIKVSIKENDFIYHHSIPANESLDKVKALESVKSIPINDHAGITDIIGNDLFEKIIPLSVHEKLSLYSESKAQILREQLEKNEINDKEYESFLEDNNIYKIFGLFKNFANGKVIDDDLVKIGKYVQSSKYKDPVRNKEKVDSLKNEISAKLARIQRLINSSSSRDISDFNQEVIEIKNSLVEASKIDQKISINEQDLKLFSTDEALRSNFSNAGGANGDSLLDLDDSSNAEYLKSIQKIDSLLRELNNLKSEKGHILKDLKEKIHNDDISQVLVLNSKSLDSSSQETIFKQELLKFDKLINRFDEILYNSSKTIKVLDKEIEKLFQVSQFNEIFTKFMNIVNFKQIFTTFENNFEKSIGFYTHLNDQILNELETNITNQISQFSANAAKPEDSLVDRFRTLSTTSNQSPTAFRNPSIVSNTSEKSWAGLNADSPSLPPKKSSTSQQPSYNYPSQPSYQAPPPSQQEPSLEQRLSGFQLPTPPAVPLPQSQSSAPPQAPRKPQQYQAQQYQGYVPPPPSYPQQPQSQLQYNRPPQQQPSQPQHQQPQSSGNATHDFYNTPPVFDNSMYSSLQPQQGQPQHQVQGPRQVNSFTKPYDPSNPYK